MTDENFIGVRATTADEEAVMFQQSWIKSEKENAALREENERLLEALKPLIEIKDYPDAVLMKRIRAAAAAIREGGK